MFKSRTAGNSLTAETTSPSVSLLPDQMEFYSYFLPLLKDGQYEIKSELIVDSIGSGDDNQTNKGAINSSLSSNSTQTFRVDGPRFALNAEDIHAFYPNNGQTGLFHQVLPNVLFNKRTLPWERNLSLPPKDAEETSPWMALLCFDESELANIKLSVGTVAQALSPRSDCSLPLTFASDENEDKELAVSKAEKELSCQTLEIPSDLFLKVAPSYFDLPYLAHCRQINTGGKVDLGLKDEGWFSVLVGNRFPQNTQDKKGLTHVVHVVSLEGCQKYLPNYPEDSTNPKDGPIPLKANIQLFSLINWSFNCLPDLSENFAKLMENMMLEQRESPAKGLLRLPEPTSSEPTAQLLISSRFAKGYSPFEHRTETGERSLAWYRGPLTPYPLKENPQLKGSNPKDKSYTGDKLRIYDENTGTFDLSYAAAFQLGRLLALGDTKFTQGLMAWRLKTRQQQQAKESQNARLPAFNRASGMNLKPTLNSALSAEQADEPEPPQVVVDWLKQALLLQSVPFHYLIPQEALLPSERLRFFYVDTNWITALIQGGFSLGLHTGAARTRDEALRAAALAKAEEQIQEATLKTNKAQNPEGNWPPGAKACYGFLMRSTVVSTWPGLTVRFKTDDQPEEPSPQQPLILRQERLAPDVLLVLFNNISALYKDKNGQDRDKKITLLLVEPQEQLCFGADEDDHDNLMIQLREIDKNKNLGSLVLENGTKGTEIKINLEASFRTAESRVLEISPPDKNLNQNNPQFLLNQFSHFKKLLAPQEYALQMLKLPLTAEFEPKTAKKGLS